LGRRVFGGLARRGLALGRRVFGGLARRGLTLGGALVGGAFRLAIGGSAGPGAGLWALGLGALGLWALGLGELGLVGHRTIVPRPGAAKPLAPLAALYPRPGQARKPPAIPAGLCRAAGFGADRPPGAGASVGLPRRRAGGGRVTGWAIASSSSPPGLALWQIR
jgi:hypothetical protein